jgi:hypothetical protein
MSCSSIPTDSRKLCDLGTDRRGDLPADRLAEPSRACVGANVPPAALNGAATGAMGSHCIEAAPWVWPAMKRSCHVVKRLPAYAPELNLVAGSWSSLLHRCIARSGRDATSGLLVLGPCQPVGLVTINPMTGAISTTASARSASWITSPTQYEVTRYDLNATLSGLEARNHRFQESLGTRPRPVSARVNGRWL